MAISYQRKLGDGTIVIDSGTSNVGIGTNNPDQNLHINSSSASITGIAVTNTSTGASRLYFDASNGDLAGSDYMWIGQNNDLSGEIVMTQSAGAFHIKTQPGGTITPRLTVLQDGNVGIGTTSPIGTLEVQAASSIDGTQLTIANDYGESSKVLAFNNDTDQVGYLSVYGRPSTGGDGPYMSLGLSNGTSVVERLHIAKNGSLDFNAYGAGSFKGNALYGLGVDSSGNVVETSGTYFGTNTSNTYTNQWHNFLELSYSTYGSVAIKIHLRGHGNTSAQSLVGEIEFNFKNQNGTIRSRATVNSYGTTPISKDDIAIYYDTTNSKINFYWKVKENYTSPQYYIDGYVFNYIWKNTYIGDDTDLASETNDSITSNLKFQGITQDNDSGYVGIGTATPNAKLDVQGGDILAGGDIHIDNMGGYVTFYGNNSGMHSITSRDTAGDANDDIRINSYGNVLINLDSNNNNNNDAAFLIGRHGGANAAMQSTGLFVVREDGLITANGVEVVKPLPGMYMGASSITDEYLVLMRKYPGTATNATGLLGKIVFQRGGTSAGNDLAEYEINMQTAYTNTAFWKFKRTGANVYTRIDEITIDGVSYYALRARSSGGGASLAHYFEGKILNGAGDSLLLTRVRESDANVTLVSAGVYYPDYETLSNNYMQGSLGVGASTPSKKFHVADSGNEVAYFQGTGNSAWIDIKGAASELWSIGATSVGYGIYNRTDGSYRFNIDNDGNVGIGTTPSSWGTGFLGLDLGGSTAANIGGGARTRFASNLYYDGSNFKYKNNYGGSYYFQDAVNINHTWGTAVTGTGGATATLVERMRIDSSGNVGIGTTSPDSFLQVKTHTHYDYVHDLHQKIATFNPSSMSGAGSNASVNIGNGSYGTSGTENLYLQFLNTHGNYGYPVGWRLKSYTDLDATGASSTFAIQQIRRGNSTSANDGTQPHIDTEFLIKQDGTIQFPQYGAGFLQTDANGNITAGAVTTSDTLDDVTDNGNSTTNSITVGGVTSTGGGEMQGGDLYFKNGGDDGAGTHIGNVWYSVSTGGGAAPVGVYESAVITTVQNGTHGRSDLVFKTKNNDTANFGSASERMRITKDGKVGIGTTGPAYKLDTEGDIISSGDSNGRMIGFNFFGSLKYNLYVDGTTDADKMIIRKGTTSVAAFNTNGNVGIGTTNPATLLHLGSSTNGANIISLGDASIGGPHGLDFYGDDATRTLKYSIYYRTGTENISMETSDGTKRFEINQSGAVTLNEAFTFPTADGSAGAALVTNGSGSLSWNAGYQQYTPVGWGVLNNQTYTSTGSNISSNSTQAQAGTTPVQRNSATEFEATKAGWYEISYSFIVKNNYTNRAMIGAYMTASSSGGGGVIPGSHSTQYVRYSTYGEYAQIQNTFYYYTSYSSTNFYLLAYLLSGSMNMTTQAVSQSMISFRYINNDIT